MNIIHKFVNEIMEEYDINHTEFLPNAAEEFINNNTISDEDVIKAAKEYIGLDINKNMDEEERYFNSRDKEYDAFLAGVKYIKDLIGY
jgi:hypothetical protein